MDEKISSMYAKKRRSYFGQYGSDVFKTVVCLILILGVTIYMSLDSFLKDARMNWDANKCNPIYMPFAGSIAPEEGKSVLEATTSNFNHCIHKDVVAGIGILLMPLEFVSFMILTMLDLIIKGLIETMKLYAYFSETINTAGKEVNDGLGNVIVQLTIALTRIRDAMSKGTAVMLTTVYTTFTIYNVVVSGLLNILNIILTILMVQLIIIAGLTIIGGIMVLFPPTLVVGLGILILAVSIYQVTFLPLLIMYIIMAVFMTDTFGSKAVPVAF